MEIEKLRKIEILIAFVTWKIFDCFVKEQFFLLYVSILLGVWSLETILNRNRKTCVNTLFFK